MKLSIWPQIYYLTNSAYLKIVESNADVWAAKNRLPIWPKKNFFWLVMLRRLFSIFRDEKFFPWLFLFFFRISFFSYSQLFSFPANNFSMNWFHACLYYFIKKMRLWPQTLRRRSFFVVHPSESQCVSFVLAQLKDLFWPQFHRFLPDLKPISKQRFPPTNVHI